MSGRRRKIWRSSVSYSVCKIGRLSEVPISFTSASFRSKLLEDARIRAVLTGMAANIGVDSEGNLASAAATDRNPSTYPFYTEGIQALHQTYRSETTPVVEDHIRRIMIKRLFDRILKNWIDQKGGEAKQKMVWTGSCGAPCYYL